MRFRSRARVLASTLPVLSALIVAQSISADAASGAVYTWDGGPDGTGTSWGTNTNWVDDTLPVNAATNNLLFDNTSSGTVAVGGVAMPAATGTLTVSATRTLGLLTFSNVNGKLPTTLTVNTNGTGGTTARTLTLHSGVTLENTSTSVVWGGANGALTFALGANNTFTTSTGSRLQFNDAVLISGPFGITTAGTGAVRINSNLNTFTGGVTVGSGSIYELGGSAAGSANSGVVTAGVLASGTIGTGTFNLQNGATVRSSGSGTRNIQNNVVLNGDLIFGSTSTFTGAINFNSTDGTNALTTSATTTLGSDVALTANVAVSLLNPVVGSGRQLAKTGPGTLTLSNTANTYSGGTAVRGGIVRTGVNGSLGTGTVTLGVAGGGDASLISYLAGYSYSNAIVVAAGTGGTSTLGSTSTFASGTTFAGDITLNGNLVVTNVAPSGNYLTLSGDISGSGGITKIDAGATRLSGSNSFSGGINVNAGTLEIRTAVAFGAVTNAVTIGDAILSLDLSSGTSTSFVSPVALNAGTSRISVASGETWNANGAVTGTGTLNKLGTGTIYLSNANSTFSGPVNLTAGNIRVNGTHNGAGNYVGASGTILGGSGTINLAVGASVVTSGTIAPGSAGSAIGTLTVDGPVALFNGPTPGALQVDLDPLHAQTADLLAVSGSLDLTGSSLTVNAANVALPGTAFVIASYGTRTGTFANEAAVNALGYTVDYAYDTGTSTNNVALVAVPEPTTLAAIGGLGVLALRRRGRR